MIQWAGLTGHQLDKNWHVAAPLVNQTLTRTGADADYSTDDILDACKAGDMQCWIAHDDGDIQVVAITEILRYPRRSVLGVPYVGAKKHSIRFWKPFISILEAYARTHDCVAWRGGGREGWAKVFNPDRKWYQFEINIGQENGRI